jgi:hypothetical protein
MRGPRSKRATLMSEYQAKWRAEQATRSTRVPYPMAPFIASFCTVGRGQHKVYAYVDEEDERNNLVDHEEDYESAVDGRR